MEGLAPTHNLCAEIRMLIERGESLYDGLRKILPDFDYATRADLIKIIFEFEQKGAVTSRFESKSIHRQEVLQIIASGLGGEPIAARLKEVEIEIQTACEGEIEAFVSALPIRAMMPVLLMQFPAFLMLMFGPIVQEITRSFSQ